MPVPNFVQKINDYVWEIPKSYKQGMRVPARIWGSQNLVANMDMQVYDQITNVATLPGIINYAHCMPDGHSGYGFPIGGVAAMDTETGVISPGGIGFDVNCLAKDSLILSEYGYFRPIQDFESEFVDINISNSPYNLKLRKFQQSVTSFDLGKKSFTSKEIAYFMKKQHSGSILQIKTTLGYQIRVTEDHPILTKDGMIDSKNLVKSKEIAIYPFKGVSYEKISEGENIIDENIFTKQEKDELQKRNLLPFSLKNSNIPIITKLFGYLLGDGNIYISGEKGFVNAYGSEEDLKEIQEDLKKIGFSAGIYSRVREHSIPTRYGVVKFKGNNYELHTSSKALAKLFFAIGYPIGPKTNCSYLIPNWIMKSPLWIKRLFLSGFFGAELSSPRTHTKTGFDCPTISVNKNSSLLNNGREFCIQLISLLDEFGVKTHKLLEREDYKNRFGSTHRIRVQISSQEDNIIILWENIGFSYNKKRDLLSKIAIMYCKEKKFLTEKRVEISNKIKELRETGLKLAEVQKLLASPIANKRFIQRHYYDYEKCGHRITLDFPSFERYVEIKKSEIAKYGTFFDEIESIREEQYDGYVYDFNILGTHNFISDNVIISNCGMRLVLTNLTYNDVKPKLKELVDMLFQRVPAGVGSEGFMKFNASQFREMIELGSKWCVENNYGLPKDLECTEENGTMKGADASKVSDRAIKRGLNQVGTLGSGNHYLEVQHIKTENIFDEHAAKAFGIFPDQIAIMLHCGSRGFGHQVATDYLSIFLSVMEKKYGIKILDRELACAPFRSKEGQDYFAAMKCAINMSFANRQTILHRIREVFAKVFGKDALPESMRMVYDVAHNTAKLEKHKVDGQTKEVLVHRKGATRSFGPGREEVPVQYRSVGQPVIIGGSMETGSYLLVGTKGAEENTWGTTAHGSGRTMSRTQAKRMFNGEKLQRDMEKRGIYVRTISFPGLAEEAGDAYKDIDEVINATHHAGISKKVVRFLPIGNVKG